MEEEEEGPLEIIHEKVVELVLRKFCRSHIRIACADLKKLVMMCEGDMDVEMIFPIIECRTLEHPDTVRIQSGYNQAFRIQSHVPFHPQHPLCVAELGIFEM